MLVLDYEKEIENEYQFDLCNFCWNITIIYHKQFKRVKKRKMEKFTQFLHSQTKFYNPPIELLRNGLNNLFFYRIKSKNVLKSNVMSNHEWRLISILSEKKSKCHSNRIFDWFRAIRISVDEYTETFVKSNFEFIYSLGHETNCLPSPFQNGFMLLNWFSVVLSMKRKYFWHSLFWEKISEQTGAISIWML